LNIGSGEKAGKSALPHRIDFIFKGFTAFCAGLVFLVIFAMALELVWNSRLSLREFGLGFLFSADWDPVMEKFGALSSIFGTLVSTLIAMLLAVPLALVTALFLVELAPPALSRMVGAG
jgi:phosphate transport system permease protein